jgi:signal transduction histidine kinase
MRPIGWFRLCSLRAKLGLAAGAGLLSAATLTALLLLTTWNSAAVVATARDAQQRVHTFNDLLDAARDYHGASYLAVREPGPSSTEAFAAASRHFETVIEEASQLKVSNLREREVRARIAAQSRVVIDHFRNAEPLVNQVDKIWQEQGSRAALLEVNRVIAPVKLLEATLEEEIHRGDVKVSQAVAHARWLNRLAIVAAVTCLLLAVGFLILVESLLRRRLRPALAQLEEGARAIAGGELEHRIALHGDDELAVLAKAFDSMAETIAEKQDALKKVQLGLERAVADRTCELEQANDKLSAADERRRAFLADVSHQLRTPLTIIRGETEVALKTADDPSFDPQEAFEHILDQTQHLGRMVNDLFLIARAEAGGLPLDRQPHDLGEMVTRVAGDFENLARENGGSIRARVQPGVVTSVDADRLRRALTALIENTMRHCQPGVNIVLEVETREGSAMLAVCDDGPGIDPADAERLFERFRRGDSHGEGSGLGLSLVRALVEAHGGKARLEARVPRGTRAVIELPRTLAERIAA